MPAPTVDRALVLHVARLAALSMSEFEADGFAAELGRIVAYVVQLDELDTRNVLPTAHVELNRTPWREDDVKPSLSRDEALEQAPRVEQGGFAVPTFVE